MHDEKATELNRFMVVPSHGGLLSKMYKHSETNVENLVNFQITNFYKKYLAT